MSDLPFRPPLPSTGDPYRIAARRLRWLRAALLEQLTALSGRTGIAYRLDDRALAGAFVAWLRRIEAQHPSDPADRRAFFDFAAGTMLHELLTRRVVVAEALPEGTKGLESLWPEGFACTVFCINMRAAVLAQEFGAASEVAPEFFDQRVWESFRENVAEQASRAVGFLEMFTGGQPDWATPLLFRSGGGPAWPPLEGPPVH